MKNEEKKENEFFETIIHFVTWKNFPILARKMIDNKPIEKPVIPSPFKTFDSSTIEHNKMMSKTYTHVVCYHMANWHIECLSTNILANERLKFLKYNKTNSSI